MDRAREVMKDLWNGHWSDDIYGAQPYRLNTRHYDQWFALMNEHIFSKYTEPIRVLEFGCGAGHRWHALESVCKINEYVALDYSPAQLKMFENKAPGAKEAIEDGKLSLVEFDLDDLPLNNDGPYDLVFTAGCLMHLYPDTAAKVLQEMFRLSVDGFIMHLEENETSAADLLNGYNLVKFYSTLDMPNLSYASSHFIHQATDGYHPNINIAEADAYRSQIVIYNNKGIKSEAAELERLDYHCDHGKRMLTQDIKI